MATAIGIALSVGSAAMQIRQGQAAAAQYEGQARGLEVQADWERFKGRQEALKHKREANNQLQAILENLARTTAIAGAGNVDPFTGSPAGVKTRILDVGGRNVVTATENAEITKLVGQFQASQFLHAASQARAAGKAAKSSATFGALATLAGGAFNFAQAGGFSALKADFAGMGSWFGSTSGAANMGGCSAPNAAGGMTGFAY